VTEREFRQHPAGRGGVALAQHPRRAGARRVGANQAPWPSEQNIKPSNLDGAGITDAATLKLALTAANRLTHEILEGLSANDLRAAYLQRPHRPSHGHHSRAWTTCSPARSSAWTRSCSRPALQGIIPVVPPLGFDGDGKTYRVNSDRGTGTGQGAEGHQTHLHHRPGRLALQGPVIRQMLGRRSWTRLAAQGASFAPDILSKAQHAVVRLPAGVPRSTSSTAGWMKRCWRRCFPTKASAR
jgi:amino-acid N-acetyltransferase